MEWLWTRAKPCHGITCLVSESRERRLSPGERARVWFHLSVCGWCRNFNSQTSLLSKAVRELAEKRALQPLSSPDELSAEAREKIKQSLRNSA